jgi:hypothetical protein
MPLKPDMPLNPEGPCNAPILVHVSSPLLTAPSPALYPPPVVKIMYKLPAELPLGKSK